MDEVKTKESLFDRLEACVLKCLWNYGKTWILQGNNDTGIMKK